MIKGLVASQARVMSDEQARLSSHTHTRSSVRACFINKAGNWEKPKNMTQVLCVYWEHPSS